MLLPLRVLRPFARLVLAVFLALDHAAVARQKTLLLQKRAQGRLKISQGSADAVAHGSGLTGEPAALNGAPDIELTESIGRHERLVDQHTQHRPRKVDRAFAAVNIDFAA